MKNLKDGAVTTYISLKLQLDWLAVAHLLLLDIECGM